MYTNKMRMTGLSGIDTQTMVEQLMKAESYKLTRYQKSTQLITWKQDAYRSTASNMQKFQNDFLSFSTTGVNMRAPSTYSNFLSTIKLKSTGKESNAATIISTSGVKSGKYTLQIKQLAQKEVQKSADMGGTINLNIDGASELKAGDTFTFNLDGTTKVIKLDSAITTNADLVTALQTKLTEAFGTESVGGAPPTPKINVTLNAGKVEIKTELGHTLSMGEGSGRDTAKTLSNDVDFTAVMDTGLIKFDVDYTDSVGVAQTKNIEVTKTENMTLAQYVTAANKKLSEEGVPNLRLGIDSTGNRIVFSSAGSKDDIKVKGSDGNSETLLGLNPAEEVTIEHTSILGEVGLTGSVNNLFDTKMTLNEAFGITGSNMSFKINGIEIKDLNDTDTVQDLINKVNKSNSGVKLAYSQFDKKFILEGLSEGAINAIAITDDTANIMSQFGFTQTKAAQDSIFVFNGQESSRTSNTIDIDGVKFQLNEVTGADELEINVSNDIDKTIENIKGFIDAYNVLLGELQDTIKETRVRKNSKIAYEPLTDEERDSMSESQIEKWEKEAKKGMLYKDDILGRVVSDLRKFSYEAVTLENGTKISLYEIGITMAPDYKEGGKLVIDEKKLRTALEERGEDVTALLTQSSNIGKDNLSARRKEQGITERMNDIIQDAAIGSSSAIANRAGLKNSVSEFTNDMYYKLTEELKKMTKMEQYLFDRETYYYNMFAKMEAAMTQSNNQMSYLMSQLGG